MQLLRDAKVPDGATLGHLDLVTLLRGRIPIDLPNHEQLYIGVVLASARWLAGEKSCLPGCPATPATPTTPAFTSGCLATASSRSGFS